MKSKYFNLLLVAVLILCVAVTICHIFYIADAYEHCSIIRFIAGEKW